MKTVRHRRLWAGVALAIFGGAIAPDTVAHLGGPRAFYGSPESIFDQLDRRFGVYQEFEPLEPLRKSPEPLEKKLWKIIDILIEDEGKVYPSSIAADCLFTVVSKPVVTEFTRTRMGKLVDDSLANYEAASLPLVLAPDEKMATRRSPRTGKEEQVPARQITQEKKAFFFQEVCRHSLNALGQCGATRDLERFENFRSTSKVLRDQARATGRFLQMRLNGEPPFDAKK